MVYAPDEAQGSWWCSLSRAGKPCPYRRRQALELLESAANVFAECGRAAEPHGKGRQ